MSRGLASHAACVLLFDRTTPLNWLLYNLHFVALFLPLGALSFVLFEPVYTITGPASGVQSPDAALGQAIPLSAAFGLLAGTMAALAFGWSPHKATSIVVTFVVLSVLLGHNAAILGMVQMTKDAVPLLAEFYGLMAVILLGNAGAFLLLERRRLFRRDARAP